jgi:hypothetical protein
MRVDAEINHSKRTSHVEVLPDVRLSTLDVELQPLLLERRSHWRTMHSSSQFLQV